MDLKFTFGGASSGHSDGRGAPPAFSPQSSSLDLVVSLADSTVIADAVSGDGVSYARVERTVDEVSDPAVATAAKSVLSRVEAELPEPLRGTASAIELRLGAQAAAVLAELGIEDGERTVNAALQARTGITEGTAIRLA